MFKQVYRFLSIFLAANILFSPAVLAKSQKEPNGHKRSIIQRIFGLNKPAEQKPNNNQNNIQKPSSDDDGGYVTKYGVYFNDDIYNTYPPVKPNTK